MTLTVPAWLLVAISGASCLAGYAIGVVAARAESAALRKLAHEYQCRLVALAARIEGEEAWRFAEKGVR